jgi:putative inorganic carbon (HCO3(-)) transporter
VRQESSSRAALGPLVAGWLGAAVLLTAALFTSRAADPVNPIKLAAAGICASGALATWAVVTLRLRTVTLVVQPAAAAAAMLLALGVSAASAPVLGTALFGTYGRNSGLVAYTAALLLFVAGASVLTGTTASAVGACVLVAGAFTATYGLLQRMGVDAIGWSNPFNPVIAALGNPDFAGAYVGLCTPLAVGFACRRGLPTALRLLCGALGALLLLVALLAEALQGPLAAACGLLVLAAAALTPAHRTAVRVTAGVGGGFAVLAAGTAVAGVGPARHLLVLSSAEARGWYAQAALTMFRRRPLTGVGLDAYGTYWRRDRPLAAPRAIGGDNFSDAAHSVPLQMLAQGGLLLLGCYLVLMAVVVLALVSGLRRLDGDRRMLLAALGGAWVAAQVQAWVSIDQVPLIVVQYVLGAALIAASDPPRWSRAFGPKPAPAPQARRGRGRPVPPPLPPPSRVTVGAMASILLVAALAGWWSSRPFRADLSAQSGNTAFGAGDAVRAEAAFERATHLMPHVARYWARLAALHNGRGDTQRALDDYRTGLKHDPTDVDAWRNAGRLAEALAQRELALSAFRRAVSLDPNNEKTINDLATYEIRTGRPADAERRLTTGVRLLPRAPELWASLGEARRALGDRSGARAAYERAREIQPSEPTAAAGLRTLDETH